MEILSGAAESKASRPLKAKAAAKDGKGVKGLGKDPKSAGPGGAGGAAGAGEEEKGVALGAEVIPVEEPPQVRCVIERSTGRMHCNKLCCSLTMKHKIHFPSLK